MNFPLFIDLKDKKVLIVGAGAIAARRATVLTEFGAKVTVVAPEAGSGIQELAQAGSIVWRQHIFRAQDLEELAQSFLVIAVTSDRAVNDHIVHLCHERHIPVNHAGDQTQCDFQFPAIVQKGPVVLGVNANGKDHGLVRRVAERLREWIAREKF